MDWKGSPGNWNVEFGKTAFSFFLLTEGWHLVRPLRRFYIMGGDHCQNPQNLEEECEKLKSKVTVRIGV